MKYLYRGTEYIASVYDEIEDDIIKELYPNTIIYSDKFDNPTLDNGVLREKTKEEIESEKKLLVEIENGYLTNRYTEYTNQEIKDNQILIPLKSVDLASIEFYKVEGNNYTLDIKKKDTELKIREIKRLYENLDKIKNSTVENGFIYKGNLRQKLRDTDLINANGVLNAFQKTKSLGIPLQKIDWQFDNINNGIYEYASLSEQEFNELYLKGITYKQACFKAEELTREQIDKMTLEQLEKVQIEALYKQVLEQVLKTLKFE
ncbi:hypothetical protein [Pseudostreptobacillus hongkongensis]|uniref:hypothetical protein n=1 Tax=Pseudostreptobacillus hongkongensis TaxID=1162717 RepID=UPI000837438B|nr:hypothetical protein [Pseudostreptobacillus hongkongensis]